MLNDYLSDLRLLEVLGLIMLGLTLLWITISGTSSLIQHWRRPKRPDAPAPLPADDREDFIRDQRPEEPDKREMPLPAPFQSEQTDDCAMPAVQTENSDEWPSMEQPQTTELVSVVAAPEDSSNLDSPPSETVVSEKQDVKPECVPVPDIRWRRSMTLPDYKKTFLVRVDYDLRASLYVSAPTKRKILEVLKKIGGERLTATSYVDNILRHHLEMFRDEINCIHQEQNYHNIV